jgi:hypothetical protein
LPLMPSGKGGLQVSRCSGYLHAGQHTSAYVSKRQHTSAHAYVSRCSGHLLCAGTKVQILTHKAHAGRAVGGLCDSSGIARMLTYADVC